ncbi:hypothetical protein DRQ09_01470 [candidate division KSB1 bacterium]|mgnify:CR=1 FL=1|nr:MAG: hypothetical protein DRQ09_01470 [candidate division KSB1 bacterium]
MRYKFIIVIIINIFFSTGLNAQFKKFIAYEFEHKFNKLLSNSITDILIVNDEVWFGTGKGLSVTKDNGKSFITFYSKQGIGKGSVSALAVDNGIIWVATGFDTTTSQGVLPAGSGLSYSTDDGLTWNKIPQPVDLEDENPGYKPTTTNVTNLTYDIAFDDSSVWIVSYGGGLRKSTDYGESWKVVTPDNNSFDPLTYLNHRAFSVVSAENGLWVGTAGGINKSTDGGITWINYNAQNGSGISGNFIVALAEQKLNDKSIIWAASWKAAGEEEFYAVSKTENGGLTWETALHGEQVHNFFFNGKDVYVLSDNGLWKSSDFGKTWGLFPQIIDEITGEKVYTQKYYSGGFGNGILWIGTDDGLAQSFDYGYSWKIFRAFEEPEIKNKFYTYAYPNPFSPLRHNRINNEGHIRIQYNTINDTEVSIYIYDFSMKPVRTVVENKFRAGGFSYSEVWNGKDDYGRKVANGVYFYKLVKKGEKPLYGKIVIID